MNQIGILYMIPRLIGYAGTEKHLLLLASNLDSRRFIPHICCFRGSDKVIRLFRERDIPCKNLEMNKIYGVEAAKNMFGLFGYIKDNNIKILQSFHPTADLYGPIVGKVSGVPIIISSRRDLGLNRRNVAAHKKINYLVQKIITPAEIVKRFTMEQENVPEAKIVVIYNGVDTDYFNEENNKVLWRSKIGLQTSDFVVTIVANFHKVKGIDYFVRAASLIAKEISEAKFIIIGDGEERENIKLLSQDLQVFDKIMLTGNIWNVRDYLAATDVYVCSSLSEGFSNSIIEAMAMGLPVVATDVGGNGEAIRDGESGFIVQPGDVREIASKVILLYQDQEKKIRMGETSRKIVEECFSVKQMVKEHEELYESLLRRVY